LIDALTTPNGLMISSGILAFLLSLLLTRQLDAPKAGCLSGITMFALSILAALTVIYWPYEERESSTTALVIIWLPIWVSLGSVVGLALAVPIQLMWRAKRPRN
jgi:hypothetical protein